MDDLKLIKNQTFGYWFDFGDNWWHQIKVVGIDNKPVKGKYPKITNRVGQSPPQYMALDE